MGQGPPEDRSRAAHGAGAGLSRSHGRRQAADGQVQAAAGLQGRDLGLGRARCARAAPGRRRHRVRELAVRRQQGLRGRSQGQHARGQDRHRQDGEGCRHRVPQGRAVPGDAQADRALRRHRFEARQRRHADGAVRQAARRRRPQLEVPAHPQGQALLPDRRALQHLRSRRVRQDLSHEPRRQRHRDHRERRAQHGRLRLRSQDRPPLVHRQRPRLDERGDSQRRAQRRHRPEPALRLSVSATRATSPIRNSAGASRAATT